MEISDIIIRHEATIRMVAFLGILTLMAGLELANPCRKLRFSRRVRWSNNLALVVFNTLMLRLLFPASAVGIATVAYQWNPGLLKLFNISLIWQTIIAFVLLDLVIYAQHVLVHRVPVLWRLHKVHHLDPDYDVTTGSRFHTLEILFSMLVKSVAIVIIGAPPVAVVLFELVLNAMAMFNHANISLPAWLDRPLRWLLVTPDMHRVHHSQDPQEHHRNFGFNLSVWDRWFGTYKERPALSHKDMLIGLNERYTDKQITRLTGMLTIPFLGKTEGPEQNR